MRKTIYVVESPDLIRLYKDALESPDVLLRGFLDPRTALASLRKEEKQPGLLLTGYLMNSVAGGMNGAELVQSARQIFPELPTILATALAPEEFSDEPTMPRIDRIVVKPFSVSKLREVVQEVLYGPVTAA